MTPELWERLKPLFHAALERGVGDRAAFIAEACGPDAELKQNLEQLVNAAQDESKTIDGPMVRLPPTRSARFGPGEIILDRFRIVRLIGRGGMGEVYEAEDLQLGRVALKTVRYDIASSSGVFDRFRQEVQLARKVSGPQVCRIHELYLLPASQGQPATAFLTMEYLDGLTLSAKLKNEGPLPLTQALRVALGICEGLRLVHANGVIHRDLKSANIMLCGQDDALRAILMDFGLARDFSADGASVQEMAHVPGHVETLPGTILGTPAYMAPEQFEGKPVSLATDIYALGVVLYELVTGLHPYAAPTPVAAAIRRAHHPAPPSSLNDAIPRKWDRVIHRCLQYEPVDRFQSADEVARALRAGPANINNLRQDRPWLFRIACAAIAALIAWGVFLWWQTRQYYHPSPEALGLYNNGLSLIRQGNYAEATRVLQAALNQDPRFVMAHARLAEAWYDLDFQGSAQQELLIALPARNRLPSLDRRYLDAIRATVAGDASTALEEYRRILDDLPQSDKSSGYVDLGMAYERAGDIPRALDSYSQAAARDTNNPAAYMHTGILQSRLHHVKEGDQAFGRAQAIFEGEIDSYGRSGNPEGLAELDYERGYAANDRGDSKDAVPLLQRSLDEAVRVPSIQLEIRALAQLSSAESSSDLGSEAVEHAKLAIRQARDNRLESWAAIGLVMLANAELDQGHLMEAEDALDESLQLVHQSPQPRVEAMANLTLAILMNQQHLPDRVFDPAQAALEYYKKNGFFQLASTAALLIVRVQRDKGQYRQALNAGDELLSLAKQSGSPALGRQAEQLVGTVYLEMEQYPDALEHFQNARSLADTNTFRAYSELSCADVLWRLGRFSESDAMLRPFSGDDAMMAILGEIRVGSLLSQQRYAAALTLAGQKIGDQPAMPVGRKLDLEQDEAVAEAHLGMKKEAMAGLSKYVVPEQPNETPVDSAQRKLSAAEIYLWLGMDREAQSSAQAAQSTFASTGLRDSELRSALLAAAASKYLKDIAAFETCTKIVVDILGELRKEWGPELLQKYISRPDIRALALRAAK